MGKEKIVYRGSMKAVTFGISGEEDELLLQKI